MININILNGGNMSIVTGTPGPAGHPETRVTYFGGETDTFNIEGELTDSSIDNISDVEEVDIGNTVTSIGENAFRACEYLMSVTIPDTVTSIGYEAFDGCYRLTSVTIPNRVTSIGENGFRGCLILESVTIPNSVMSIGPDAFGYCSGLTSVTFLGKTLEQVQNIEDGSGNKQYPWGIENTSIIHVA